ncbi:LacI family DNA-binding transcriptional regulator [Alkalihalobacillus hemicellulosilyticus]|uniref:Catabolite control protein A n=1 Tax=Halalkalibacter hemicellulosilyticusJCM 9152 TaxID=1236971 RepID=W4QHJ7_9BACI|nr:LacI family DNA-binding transcriptional regulator [Halalkalibacter hemicellulosilyticus]GAE31556.1 catabolite control protein A [Halalkalibacter hemicellulosilyticusJCM 9152]
MKKGVTIYDIAKEAQVSPATVSRVLTGNAKVKPTTMKKITAVIEKYNFKPNGLARSLLQKKTKMIGFILPDINHPFFSTFVLKGEAHALDAGYTSFVCNTMNDSEMESKYLHALLEKQVDGIVFLGGRINAVDVKPSYVAEMNAIMERAPVLFVNGQMPGVDAHVVRTDEASGVRQLVELCKNHGHEKIGFLGGVCGITSTEMKIETFKEELRKQGMEVVDDWVISSNFTIESGEEAAAKLMSLDEKPTAVLCVNDFVAMGAIIQFQKYGLSIPDDMSVAGFDDIYLAQHFPPGITTVSQNYDRLGETAINRLVDLIEEKEVVKETVVPTSLIIRKSCKSIPKKN